MHKDEKRQMFYTVDPDYKQFNGMTFEVLRKICEGRRQGDARYAIRLENGYTIRAFEDELNSFIREHENDPILLPVTWEECGFVSMQCQSIIEALDIFDRDYNDIPRPEGEYACDSFGLTSTEPNDMAYFNHPFRDPDRKRNIQEAHQPKEVFWKPIEKEELTQEGTCPICGGAELKYSEDGVLRDRKCGYMWKCQDCGAEGTDWFDLSFSRQTVDRIEWRQ